ncbi:hypothetical protein HK101_009855 [Irineochytrium annulatum]|nr:hypothetical protein HK101_009855 [Irineochytrium annulatum]
MEDGGPPTPVHPPPLITTVTASPLTDPPAAPRPPTERVAEFLSQRPAIEILGRRTGFRYDTQPIPPPRNSSKEPQSPVTPLTAASTDMLIAEAADPEATPRLVPPPPPSKPNKVAQRRIYQPFQVVQEHAFLASPPPPLKKSFDGATAKKSFDASSVPKISFDAVSAHPKKSFDASSAHYKRSMDTTRSVRSVRTVDSQPGVPRTLRQWNKKPKYTPWHKFLFACFWIKASFAFSAGLGGLGFLIKLVIISRHQALLQQSLDAAAAATWSNQAPLPNNGLPPEPPSWTAQSCPAPVDGNGAFAPSNVAFANVSAGGRLEPKAGTKLWGFEIDWDVDTPSTMRARMGVTPPLISSELHIYNSGWDADGLLLMAREIAVVNAVMQIRVIPEVDIVTMKDGTIEQLASLMQRINFEFNVPVLLSYAPDVNGHADGFYKMRPIQYLESFKLMTNAIRNMTNMTAMVWTTTNAALYPFYASQSPIPSASTDPANLLVLDTNHNGYLDAGDDPFSPYYPGDQYVDWVGLTLIQSSIDLDPTTLQTNPPEPTALSDALLLHNFYATYTSSLDRLHAARPLLLSSTGLPYRLNGTMLGSPTSDADLTLKRGWWMQIIQAFGAWENLRAVVWREGRGVEGGVDVDYGITDVAEVRQRFLNDFAGQGLTWEGIRVNCTGQVA